MKQRIYNAWLALTGINPFQKELDDVRNKYKKTAEREESLQQLVENLRERLADKDCELKEQRKAYVEYVERVKAGYQQRIDKYNEKVDHLASGKNTK